MVGAQSLVPPGMKVPPRTPVMGIPAKVKRELTEEDIQCLHRRPSTTCNCRAST